VPLSGIEPRPSSPWSDTVTFPIFNYLSDPSFTPVSGERYLVSMLLRCVSADYNGLVQKPKVPFVTVPVKFIYSFALERCLHLTSNDVERSGRGLILRIAAAFA
jgi:hypothetical protein